MENASKALIIAGAILLSILIIGLGMFIFNQAKDAMGDTGLNTQKANAYNSDFEQYFDEQVSGANVKSLYDAVRSHNVANSGTDASLTISINGKSDVSDLNSEKAKILAGKTYKVEGTTYDAKTGYLQDITCTQN